MLSRSLRHFVLMRITISIGRSMTAFGRFGKKAASAAFFQAVYFFEG
jgi:hypothetical protein